MSTALHDEEKVKRYINSLPACTAAQNAERVAEPPFATPAACDAVVEAEAIEEAEPSLPALVDLLLKDQPRLDRLARDAALQRELIPKFLAIGMLGYTVFGVGLSLVYTSAGVWPALTSAADWLSDRSGGLIQFLPADAAWSAWWDGSAMALVAAFVLGLIGAIGVCLPSFYFYGLLAGVRTSMLQITTHATKGMASAAIAVVGVLPIYVAVVLGILVFGAPASAVRLQCFVGLLLPFIAGLWGTHSLYVSFIGLSDTMSPERRCRRACFLRRLTVSWCACFTAVTPVMIFTLWEYFNRFV